MKPLTFFALLGVLCGWSLHAAEAAAKPNILVILAADLDETIAKE